MTYLTTPPPPSWEQRGSCDYNLLVPVFAGTGNSLEGYGLVLKEALGRS